MNEWVSESFFLKRTNKLLFSYISCLSVELNHPNIVLLLDAQAKPLYFNWSSLYFCTVANLLIFFFPNLVKFRRCQEKTFYVSNNSFFTSMHKWVDRGQTHHFEKLQNYTSSNENGITHRGVFIIGASALYRPIHTIKWWRKIRHIGGFFVTTTICYKIFF